MTSSLRTLSENLATTEGGLRDHHSKIQVLREQLRALRTDTNSVSREAGATLHHLQNNSSNKPGETWNSVHHSMKLKVLGSALSPLPDNRTDGDDDADDFFFNSSSSSSSNCVVDSALFQTMKLSSWFSRVFLPQMQLWRKQVDAFERRLAKVQVHAANPRLRSFCRDLRRRSRIAATLHPRTQPQRADGADSGTSPHVLLLEQEYRALAAKREAESAERRRALAQLNVQLARAVSFVAQQQK